MLTVLDSFLTSFLFGLVVIVIAFFFFLGEPNKFCLTTFKVLGAIGGFYIISPIIITFVWTMIQVANILFNGSVMLFSGG